MVSRILSAVALLLSILFMPFWVSAILGLAAMIYFPFYLEAVILFFLSDLLFGVKEPKFFNILGISLILAAISFILIELLKNKLRLNDFPKI